MRTGSTRRLLYTKLYDVIRLSSFRFAYDAVRQRIVEILSSVRNLLPTLKPEFIRYTAIYTGCSGEENVWFDP